MARWSPIYLIYILVPILAYIAVRPCHGFHEITNRNVTPRVSYIWVLNFEHEKKSNIKRYFVFVFFPHLGLYFLIKLLVSGKRECVYDNGARCAKWSGHIRCDVFNLITSPMRDTRDRS